jgi:hypothetical protein
LAEIVAFLVLGLTVGLHTLPDADGLWMGLALAVLLSFVVRPLLVGLLLVPVWLAWGERLFLLWAGLKGTVPILLAASCSPRRSRLLPAVCHRRGLIVAAVPSRQSQDRRPVDRGNRLDQPRDPRRPTIPVHGSTALQAGDPILALTDPERGPDLTATFTARPGSGAAGPVRA